MIPSTTTEPAAPEAGRHSGSARPVVDGSAEPSGRLGGWVIDQQRAHPRRLGAGDHRPGRLRAAGRSGALRRGLAGRRLRVGRVRDLAQEHFGGNASSAIEVVVHTDSGTVTAGAGAAAVARATALLEADPRIAEVVAPQQGATISEDGRTAVVLAGSGADTNEMVRAADDLAVPLEALSGNGVEVTPTGSSQLWADFNTANLDAMLTSEMFSWPVTLAILVLAFGALVAAGLPLVLTLAGLVASAGSLVLINQVVPVSIWAMNFAMMFAPRSSASTTGFPVGGPLPRRCGWATVPVPLNYPACGGSRPSQRLARSQIRLKQCLAT